MFMPTKLKAAKSLDHAKPADHLPVVPVFPAHAALFLDIDGTLLDIALRPELVTIPPGLPERLNALRQSLGGALAIISGRPLAQIDQFFPGGLPAGAEHGAILRDAGGEIHHRAARPTAYSHWLDILTAETRDLPGVLIEEKNISLVVHYRQAPDTCEILRAIGERLIAESGSDTRLLPAHMAFELRPRGFGKDDALAWFMATPPFAGRIPVFIGDDVTDEPAIALASQLGGLGLHVARDFGGSPQAVRDWLAGL
jgi:trehalose 6-phosphate phosphatase